MQLESNNMKRGTEALRLASSAEPRPIFHMPSWARGPVKVSLREAYRLAAEQKLHELYVPAKPGE